MNRSKILPTAVLVLVTASPVFSQALNGSNSGGNAEAGQTGQNDRYELKRGMNEFGIWGGGAPAATTIFGGLHKDEAADRKFLIVGLRYGRVLGARKRAALEYTFDAIPLAVAFNSIVSVPPAPAPSVRENVYGAGAAPLGLKGIFGQGKAKGFVSISGGGLFFGKPVPLPDAGKFAFTGDGGGGVEIFTGSRRAVVLGAKLHHISNGNRAGANRGLNQFILYAGFSVFK